MEKGIWVAGTLILLLEQKGVISSADIAYMADRLVDTAAGREMRAHRNAILEAVDFLRDLEDINVVPLRPV